MISDKERQLRDSLNNKEYREALAIEHVNTTIAVQIRRMREKKPWNQNDLANRLGKHQETISQWENPDYGRYSITSLKELASIFDVALLVKFIPFSELIKDMMNLSDNRLSPPSFAEEAQTKLGITGTTTPNEISPSIVSFINNIPSTPSTASLGTLYPLKEKEMEYETSRRV